MLTPLFPPDAKRITINQGQVGDCYLLASLDCILNSMADGRAKIQALFTETKHGVTVRIKRTLMTPLLQHNKLEDKYVYTYDKDSDEDVFIISREQLARIDTKFSKGVETNSLAVKIIERLSTYYYEEDWESERVDASLLAHNVNNRYMGTSTAFVGTLLGVITEDTSNINKIIKLKKINPSYPIYISMSYGEKDRFGNIHGRHGLRLQRIHENNASPGGYDFILVNPWNNQKTEKWNLNEIMTRDVRFCIFSPTFEIAALNNLLLDLSPDDAIDIVKNRDLSSLLINLCSLIHNFNSDDVKDYYALYRKMPGMIKFFSHLNLEEKILFHSSIYDSKGDKDTFLAAMLSKLNQPDSIYLLLNNETLGPKATSVAVDICLQNQDSELFKILNEVDFLAQINSGMMLEKLIDLQLAQSCINFKQLNDIVMYIKIFEPVNYLNQKINFSEESIFNITLTRAINEMAVQLENDIDKAKKTVEAQLVHYYFKNKIDLITRAGGLWSLFNDYHCSKIWIEKIDSIEWYILGVAEFINTQIISSRLKVLIQDKTIHLTQGQLNNIIDHIIIDNPFAFFLGLYELNHLNSLLATMICHQIVESFTRKFNMDFPLFIKQIQQHETNHFTQWFLATITKNVEKPIQKEQFEISNYLKTIEDFPVSYQSIYDKELINDALVNFISQVRNLKNNTILRRDQKQLGEYNKIIDGAIAKKIEIITVSAYYHASILNTAEETLTALVRKINLFSYSFTDVHDNLSIQERIEFYRQCLATIVLEFPNLKASLKTLGHDVERTGNDLILDLTNTKIQEIKHAGAEHQKRLTKADFCIKSMIKDIIAQSTRFDHLTSISCINKECAIQLEKLYSLMHNEELLGAQRILGLNQNASNLTTTIESKAQMIINCAEERILEIEQAHILFMDYHQKIKEFSISFEFQDTIEKINEQKDLLLLQLDDFVHDSEFKNALNVLSLNKLPDNLQIVFSDQKDKIKKEALCLKSKLILDKSGFFIHLNTILSKTIELEKIRDTKGDSYEPAARAARQLYDSLVNAYNFFLKNPDEIEEKLEIFKKNCSSAIEKALPTLQQHRGWKQVLVDMASVILTLVSGFLTYFITKQFFLFKVSTDSEKKIRDLERNIQQMSIC